MTEKYNKISTIYKPLTAASQEKLKLVLEQQKYLKHEMNH